MQLYTNHTEAHTTLFVVFSHYNFKNVQVLARSKNGMFLYKNAIILVVAVVVIIIIQTNLQRNPRLERSMVHIMF